MVNECAACGTWFYGGGYIALAWARDRYGRVSHTLRDLKIPRYCSESCRFPH